MLKRIICAAAALLIFTCAVFAVTESFEGVSRTENLVFFDGMAAVESDGLWGYIDSADNFSIECRFLEARPFSEGRAFVRDSSGWHCINKTGQILFTLVCEDVYPYSDGIARFKRAGLYGFINKNGQEIGFV